MSVNPVVRSTAQDHGPNAPTPDEVYAAQLLHLGSGDPIAGHGRRPSVGAEQARRASASLGTSETVVFGTPATVAMSAIATRGSG